MNAALMFYISHQDGNWKNMLSGGSLPHIYKVLNFGSKAKPHLIA